MATEITIGFFTNTWASTYSAPGKLSGTPALLFGEWRYSVTIGLLPLSPSILFTGKGDRRSIGLFSSSNSLDFHSAFAGTAQSAGPLIQSNSPLLSGTDRYAWWQEEQPITSQLIYICEITGDADGLDDIVVPLSHFQYRLYDGGEGAHIEVVVPNAIKHEDAIRNRSNGQIKVRRGQVYGNGTRRISEVARAGNMKITSNTGGRSSSVSIRGDELMEFMPTTLERHTDKIVSRRLQADRDYSFQIEPLIGLRPREYVWLDGSKYQVKEIAVAVGWRVHQMNIVASPA